VQNFALLGFQNKGILCYFTKLKNPNQQGQGNFLKLKKIKLSHFEEESYEIVKSFGEFG
jgi:hypothetical protein